jgi:hypothetical protein
VAGFWVGHRARTAKDTWASFQKMVVLDAFLSQLSCHARSFSEGGSAFQLLGLDA